MSCESPTGDDGAAVLASSQGGVAKAWERVLAVVVVATVLYWAGCKLALFADLEYVGSDFYSCLQMTKSFRYTGVPLYENRFGYHGAIHNCYLLLLFFPLTYALGAYGLILALAGLHALAAVRVLRTRVLSFWGRIAVLGTMLSPVSFWVFDDPWWGFHSDLCYPALSILFALLLLERRPFAAGLSAVALVLVKEDGPVLVAAILISYFVTRAALEPENRRRLFRHAALSLTACGLVFVSGLAWLRLVSPALDAAGQVTGDSRLHIGLQVTLQTLIGAGNPAWAQLLWQGLAGYGLLALFCGLPLMFGVRGYLLGLLAGCTLLLPVLVLSAATYGFTLVFWPPRVATLLGLIAACVAISSAFSSGVPWRDARPRAALLASLALVAFGWITLWVFLEQRLDYHLPSRANLAALLSGQEYRIGRLRPHELGFAHCLAAGLPRDFPVLVSGPQSPVFHHQALVFAGIPARPWETPRLSVEFRRGGAGPPPRTLACVGRVFVAGDEEFSSLARRCAESVAMPAGVSGTETPDSER